MAAKDKAVDGAATAAQDAPEHHLTVVHPFNQYRRGDMITDPVVIEAIKAGPNSHHCHKIQPQ